VPADAKSNYRFLNLKYFLTTHWCITMKIKPPSAYENVSIYYIIIFEACYMFRSHFMTIFKNIFFKDTLWRQPRQCTTIKYDVLNIWYTIHMLKYKIQIKLFVINLMCKKCSCAVCVLSPPYLYGDTSHTAHSETWNGLIWFRIGTGEGIL
jgi:hypothetical protein